MARILVLALAAATLGALLGATQGAATQAQNPRLVGIVGPGETIVIRDAQGNRVTNLAPGTYDIEVRDQSEFHNFHLRGPGVNRSTSVEETGTETWTVTLTAGTYTYLCDPHSTSMRGTFTVGGSSQGTPRVVTPRARLVLTSGPGRVITFRTAAGQPVRTMRTGTYRVVVRDRSRAHNARIVAPGFRRATTVPFVGQQTWRVRLARPGTLRFLCDPHARSGMRGSARIVR